MTEFTPPIESFDEWIFILRRTVQGNNWKKLHRRFQTDLSHLRKLKDTLDYFSSHPVAENEHNDWKMVKQSIEIQPDIWKIFCETFSVQMCEMGVGSIGDMQTVMNLFHRGVIFEEYKNADKNDLTIDWKVLNVVQKALKAWENKWKDRSNQNDNSVRCNMLEAFGVKTVKVNPYEVPAWVTRILHDIIENDKSINEAVDNEITRAKKANEPVHDDSWIKKEFRERFKWSALNDYLFDRVETKRSELNSNEIARLESVFEGVILPGKLEITTDFDNYGVEFLTKEDTTPTH